MTIPELTSALAAGPGNWELRLMLVQALVAEGRHDSAVEVVNQGEALPHEPGPWLAAAKAYAAVGAIEQAYGLVANSLEIDPDYEPAKTYYEQLSAMTPVALTADDVDEEGGGAHYLAPDATMAIVKRSGDGTPMTLPKVAFSNSEVQALHEAEEQAKRVREAAIRRDKLNSVAITVLLHVAVIVALTLVATKTPPRVPPQIVASSAAQPQEEQIDNEKLNKPTLDPTTAVNAAVADIISVSATSSFSVSNVDVTISDVAVETGMEFNPSMSLGMPTSAASKMMFGQPMEGDVLGVILDVSGSMAEFLPAVVREVDNNFKDAPVVYVRNMVLRDNRRSSEVRLIIPDEVIAYDPVYRTRTPYWFLFHDLPRKAPQRYVDRLIETFKTRANQFLAVGADWGGGSYSGTHEAMDFLMEQNVDSLYIFSDFADFVDDKVAMEFGQKLGRRKIRTYLQPAEKKTDELDLMTKRIANRTLGRQMPSLVSLLRGTEEEVEVTNLMPRKREEDVAQVKDLGIKLATARPTIPEPSSGRTVIHKISEPEYDAVFLGPQARVEIFLKSPEGYIQNPVVFSYHSHKVIPDHPDPRSRVRTRKFLRLEEEPSFDGKEVVWKMVLEDELKFRVHLYLGRKGMNATYVADPPTDGTSDDARIFFHIPALARPSKDRFFGFDYPVEGIKLDQVREAVKENTVVFNLPRQDRDRYAKGWAQAGFEPGYNTRKYNEGIRVLPGGIRDLVVQGPSFGPRKIHARTTSSKVLLQGGAGRADIEPWEGYWASLRRTGATRTRFTKTEAIELEIQ